MMGFLNSIFLAMVGVLLTSCARVAEGVVEGMVGSATGSAFGSDPHGWDDQIKVSR